MSNENNEGLSKENSVGASAVNENTVNQAAENHQALYEHLDKKFGPPSERIRRGMADFEETYRPHTGSDYHYEQESFTDKEFDQGAVYDLASGFWNSFVVGSVKGMWNLVPTIANAVEETTWANNWLDKYSMVNKAIDDFEYIYSDDAYKPIEKFGDINSSHFWSGLGNGIGFVAAIARGAGIATTFTKGARAFKRGKEAIEGTSAWFKAGANTRNTINTFFKNAFKKSKTAKVIKKTPKFKEGIKNAKVRESMLGKLYKIQKLSEKSMRNSARIGSFFTGTTLMYGMVQEEAKAAGLDATDSARLALGVSAVVSFTEGMALEWIGRIPAASAQKALIKKATKAIAKNSARRTPGEIMNLFTPHYAKAIRSLDVVKGASIEFGQEFVQTYIEQGAKQMYDTLWADEDATVGKGKFGTEIFDFEADSVSGFFGNKKDSYKAFTNSMFAGFLGAIIGGGMAGFQLATHPGVRNLGNESMFNLVVDDVLNEKIGREAENRKKIVETLDKALKDGSINQKQHQDTVALMDEMQEYVERNNQIKHIEDPIAQYQLYTLDKTYKEVAKSILDLNQIEEDNKTEADVVQEEKLKLAKQKNDLLETLLESIGVNMNEIFRKETAETLDPNEFNDKMLAYQTIAEKIANNEITTEEDLKDFIKEVYDTDYKKKYEETKAKVGEALDEAERKGFLLKPVEKEEYDNFKKDKDDISEQRKNYLANKLKDKKKLNKFEKEMYEAHKDEINKLKDEFIAEEKAKKEEEEGEKSEPEAEFNLKEYKDKLSKLSDKELEEEFNEITNNPSDPNLSEKMDSYMLEDAKRKKPPSTPPKSKPPVSKPPASGTETETEKEEREDNEKFAENEQKIKDKEDELKKDRENKKTGGKSYTKKQRKDIQDEIDKLKKENEEIEKKRKKRAEAKAKAEEEIKKAEEEQKRKEAEAKKKAEAEAEAKKKAEEEQKKKEREAKEKTIKDKINDILNIGKSKKRGKDYSKKSAEDVGQDLFSAVLGAMKSAPNIDKKEAQRLFKEYAKTVHPDKNNQTSEREALATAILAAMTEARDNGRVDVLKKLKELFDTEIAKLPKAEKETPPTKPKTEGDVKVDDDSDTSDTGAGSEINPQTDEGKKIENENADTAKENENKIEDDSDEEIDLEQRKGVESKSNESQKISDNPELFEKIREHFQKMFPMIPVRTINRLINKHGLEILGRVAKDGITISEEAFQSTLVHEYAHVYIDLIADKEIVKNALEWIKTTDYFTSAKQAYPSYTTEKQAMEALVQAMSENAVPKLEEKLSDSQISRWMSIAKKLWRSIKRFFTGVNSKNYLDYLSDELVFRSQPIMVETNYLDENGQEQRKAISPDVVKFNNNFLLAQTKKYVINSLRAGDNLTAERVIANLHKMLINRMESDKDLHTVALQAKFEELTEENFENFNDLTPAEKIDTLLKQTIYEEDITYNDHVLKVTEQLVKLPTEDVKQDSIEEIINKIEKEEENTGKVEKERIKGTKTISGSVNSILGTLVDSNGDKIHEDLVFSYLAKVSESSVTNQEATRKITNDAKKGNKVAIALMSVLGAAKNYDKAIPGAKVFQTLLSQMLSLQSIVYHSTNVQVNENGKKEIRVRKTSASRLKANRTAELKRRILSPEFLGAIINKDMSVVKLLETVIENSKGDSVYLPYSGKINYQFDVEQVNAIGDLIFGLDEGEFNAVDYINWLIENGADKKKNKQGELTFRASKIASINKLSSQKTKEQQAANFFMVELLNTVGEQLSRRDAKNKKSKFNNKKFTGFVGAFQDFGAAVYDGDIHNANMFINSSGNALSTIRLGSYLNRSFTAIAKHTEQAEKKNNKTVPSTTLDGRPMNYYLYRNNPVFKKIYKEGKAELTIDDAINFVQQKVTEHTGQNEIDVLIAQLTYFSNVQSSKTYWQKLMINDRSHSNFLKVNRLTAANVTEVSRKQRGVDEYLLNENYNKIKSKAEQKKYLDEFNKISLNFAYEIDGVVKVLPFNHEYLMKPMSEFGLSEEVQKGFQSKLNGITKEKNLILETLEKTKLKEGISADHVGPKKTYKNLQSLVLGYIINDRVNRLAINDIISEPVAYRLLKPKYNEKTNELEYKVDPSNIIKRNSGFDSLGVRVDLSKQKTGKTVKTVVFEMKDENGEDISDSFLFRGNQMTQAIQEQLGDKELDEIGDNSKDGEYMITEDGRNVYHKNSSINSKENIETDKDGNEVRRSNNLIDIAKAMMGENYKESRYYKMAKVLEMLEEQYGESHHIQIVDANTIKGSKLYSNEKAMSIDDIYDNVSKGDFDAIEGTSYTYDSENFYIPFNEAKKLSKKSIQNQKSRFATQLVKILTNHSFNQQIAIENSNQLEELMVELLHKQLGVKQDTEDYKNSTTGRVLFQTKAVLNALKDSVDQLQDPDTIQLIDEILKHNEEEGVRLDKAKETIKKYEEKHGKFEDYVKGVIGYNGNTKKAWAKAVRTIEEKGTINKIDHPSMLKQLKQVILSKVSSRGLDIRVPGAYLKMVPDIDGRLKSESLGDKENGVLLPWSMFGESMEEAQAFLDEQNKKGGLHVPIVRVPASDAISTLNARVVGLIGDSNMAVLPHGFTLKSDADHDGDKVFVYKPNVKTENKKTVIQENTVENKIYNLMNELMQSEDYKQRIEKGTINLDKFEDIVNAIDEELKADGKKGLRKDFNFGTSSEMSETDARLSFGEVAVGILAVAGKLNSALYQSNTYFKGTPNVTVMGKKLNLDKINAPKTSNDIAMLLQAALDIAKNPVLLTSGIDASNINIVVAMMISGVDLKSIIKFVNQDQVKDFYKRDNTKNNSFNERENKDRLKKDIEQQLKEAEKNNESDLVKENLKALMFFTELSNELKTVTSVVQLDGKLPNEGYELKEVKQAFKLMKNPKSKTKLSYTELAEKPINQHYEKIIDFALDLMTHHFITENVSYYDEIKQIQKSRENYYGVQEFDMATEKRRLDDMFALMIAQKLEIDDEVSSVKYGDTTELMSRIGESVRLASRYMYLRVKNSDNIIEKRFKEFELDLLDEVESKNEESYKLDLAFRSLKTKIGNTNSTFGELINEALDEATWDAQGKTVNGITKEVYVKQFIASLEADGVKIPVTKQNIPNLVNVAIRYKEFIEENMSEMEESRLKGKNRFLKLLQLKIEDGDYIVTGKNDIRYLTSTEKRQAQEDFLKLPLELQQDFKAYQMLKFGLSNKLGSLISIMPNDFTVEFMKYISQIEADGQKEGKIYNLDELELADNYNDLYYPVKQYKKANKLIDNKGNIIKDMSQINDDANVTLQTELTVNGQKTYTLIPGKPGVRFKIDGDENLYEWKRANKEDNVVRLIENPARKTNAYTVFREESLMDVSEDAEEQGKECGI